jgi:hypothetical protein
MQIIDLFNNFNVWKYYVIYFLCSEMQGKIIPE